MAKTTTAPPRPRPMIPGRSIQDDWCLTGRWEWRRGWWGSVVVWVEEDRMRPVYRGPRFPPSEPTEYAQDFRWRPARMEDLQRMPVPEPQEQPVRPGANPIRPDYINPYAR